VVSGERVTGAAETMTAATAITNTSHTPGQATAHPAPARADSSGRTDG
jgi:hypothetical protein